jgi:hypothetical protein
MSFAEDYRRDYRVKFVDVRVNPPGGKRRGKAAVRRCEAKACDEVGVCKAPKPFSARTIPVPGEKVVVEDDYWFCQRHAAEYNQTYDFFEGMTEAEVTAFHASAAYGHKRTWRFGGGPVGAAARAASINGEQRKWRGKEWIYNGGSDGEGAGNRRGRDRTRLQIRALEELELQADATVEQVRERYAALVKRFHPDSNGGDRSTEHRLSVVIKAFKALKSSGLA